MDTTLVSYIKSKREAGVADEKIRANLVATGWDAKMVDAGLAADLENDAPPPPPPSAAVSPEVKERPVAVVSTFSTRSIEYIIMFVSLWVSATGIGMLLHGIVDSGFGLEDTWSDVMPVAASALIVALPIFAFLFLRLKKRELADSETKKDPSRKQAIRLTLVVTFLISLWYVIGYIRDLMTGFTQTSAYSDPTNPVAQLLHVLITLSITGSIFWYYWRDIHSTEGA